MSSIGELSGRRPGSAPGRLFAFAFWGLAVTMLLNVQGLHLWGAPAAILGYGVALACCLCLMGRIDRWRQGVGTPGALMFATIASYLIIGGAVALGADTAWQLPLDISRDVLRQIFFLLVFLASLLGGRAMLGRVGVEALLKGVFAVLTASCLVILASPILRDLGVLAPYRLPYRLTGAFTDANGAGMIGCATAAVALALLGGVRRRTHAYLGLTAGCAVALGSYSLSAVLVLGALFAFFLLLNGHRGRGPIVRWLLVMCLTGIVIVFAYVTVHLAKAMLDREQQEKIEQAAAILSGESPFGKGTSNRPFLWKTGLAKALESPFAGHGLGRLHNLPGGPIMHLGKPEGVHNVYLMLVGEAGIVPLSMYCLFLFSLLRFYWTAPRSLARDVIVGWAIAMTLFGVMFQHWLHQGAFMFLAGLCSAMAAQRTAIRRRPASAGYRSQDARSARR